MGIGLAVEVVYAVSVLVAEAVVYAVAVGIDIADDGRGRLGLGADGTGQQGAGDDGDDDHDFFNRCGVGATGWSPPTGIIY